MSGYILTGPAAKDIDEVLDYIAAQSPQNAIIVAGRFVTAFERISDDPGLGHKRNELKDRNARVLFVSGYLVIYDFSSAPMTILRVVRGAAKSQSNFNARVGAPTARYRATDR